MFSTDGLADVIKKVEKEYLQLIIENLKNGNLPLPIAKKQAKEFLALLPFASFEDFKEKVVRFVLRYPLYQKIYLTILRIEEEAKTQNVLERISGLIKDKKFDEALKVVAK